MHIETIAAETSAVSIQRRLVPNGLGLTRLPAIAVADDTASKRVTRLLSDPTITRTIELALPANRVVGRHVGAQSTCRFSASRMRRATVPGCRPAGSGPDGFETGHQRPRGLAAWRQAASAVPAAVNPPG